MKGQLSSVAEIAQLVSASNDLGSMLDRICFGLCRYTRWDMCSIMSVDEEAGQSVLMARFDPYLVDDLNAPRKWDLQSSPARSVISAGQPVIIDDAQRSDTYPHYRIDALARRYHTVVILLLPACDMHGRKMVIAVQSKSVVTVDEEALEFLQAVSHLAAIAVAKAHRLSQEQQFNERMRQAANAAGDLMRLVLSDAATGPVLHAIEALMGCPVLVLDYSAHAILVASSPPGVEAGAWRAAVDLHFRDGFAALSTRPRSDDAIATSDSGTTQTQVRTLTVDGAPVGAIHFVRSPIVPMQVDDLLLQNVCFAASVMLMRSVVRTKTRSDTQAKILRELASGVHDLDDFRSRAISAGLDPRRAALLLVIAGEALSMRGGSLAESAKFVGFVLRRVFGECVSVIRDATSLLVWVSAANGGASAWKALREVAHELGHVFGAVPSIAHSELCGCEADYPAAVQSCERTTTLAQRFGRTGVLCEADFGPHSLVLASMPEKDIASFVQRTLGSLERAGTQSGADLVSTVEAFLRAGCRHQKCADAMSIHVTTLRYRLDRVRDLCSIDFDDPDSRFALDLAFRFRQARVQAE